MINILVVEDDIHFLNKFSKIIASDAGLQLAAAVRDGESALQALNSMTPDVVLVDLGLPNHISGLDVIRAVRKRYPETDIMVVTVFGDEEHVISSIRAGATGYVLKDSFPEQFVQVIKDLRAGGAPISPGIAKHLLRKLQEPTSNSKIEITPASTVRRGDPKSTEHDGSVKLTQREQEILEYIAKGFQFNEIAQFLKISENTVATHVKRLYRKLEVHNKGEAVYEATRIGLIT
jgi:DNA-binding NarL/FixJ family response regulator